MEKPWYSFLYIKSPIAKIVWGIVSALVAIAVVLVLLIMEPSRMAAQANSWQGRSIEKGADIWANNCYTCHGDHGQGGAGPALNSKHFFNQRLTDIGFAGTLPDFIKLTVSSGRPNLAHGQFSVVMPTWSNRFGGPLRDDQVQNVADYVMNWQSSANRQTPDEDPFIQFANIPVSPTTTISGTASVSGTAAVSNRYC
jgi:mono/diheme cytochrome c family protein